MLTMLLNSCATSKNRHLDYLEIQRLISSNRLLVASNKMFEYERSYPESPYLCDFSKFQLELAMSRSPKIGIDNLKNRVKKYCKYR